MISAAIVSSPHAVERVTILYLNNEKHDKKKARFMKRTYYTVTLTNYDKKDQMLNFTITEDGKTKEMLRKLNTEETEDSEIG